MGGINVVSALGEPLKAEIDLVAVGKTERSSLSAHMASMDIYKGAGMEYPASLPKLKFQLETHPNGDHYIKVTSALPVNDPFVSILVELNWSSGRLLREYTFLMDPPGFRPEQPKKQEEVAPIEPSVNEAGTPSSETAKPEAAPAVAVEPVKKSTANHNVSIGTITVKRGDTLSKIAQTTKPSDISLERMLVALYRANSDAFDGNNMNRLRTGKILHTPENSDLENLPQDEAVKEVHAQSIDWNIYRQKLAAASAPAVEAPAKQETAGKISTKVADKAPPAKEGAREVIKLSKGETLGDKAIATAGNTKALQDKVHAMEEEAIARSKSLKESNERIALLEKNIQEMQRLINLKTQPAVPAKPEVKPEPVKPEVKPEHAKPATAPATPPVAIAASAVNPAKPAAPKVLPPTPSMLDEILDEPLYLIGIAATLLGLGGAGFVAMRRRKGGKKEQKTLSVDMEDAGSTSGRIAAPVAPSPETGDFTQTIAAPLAPQTDDVDPISEAELFLNFGRDAQAEEILKDALEKDASNNRIRLKLLSIYANRNDLKNFSVIAHEVHESADAIAWAQTAEMGRRLEPGNPMYGGSGDAAAGVEPPMPETMAAPAAASLDFDLGFGAANSHDSADIPAVAPELDLDLGTADTPAETVPATGFENTVVLAPTTAATTSAGELDFDLGSADTSAAEETHATPGEKTVIMQQLQTPPSQEASAPGLEDLVFDVTHEHSEPAAEAEAAYTADVPEEHHSDAFTLATPSDEPSESEPAPAPVANIAVANPDIADINLHLGQETPASPTSEAIKDEHWQDVATKLDLAKAYQEMGDGAGAREILEEVLKEGDAQQQASAQAMLQQLPS
ncbi:MAG: hypothetical protein HY306_03710 [Nitrosomonadales bacterium]|nr:hypothetical protein [Nitrosomonadales bacterium]